MLYLSFTQEIHHHHHVRTLRPERVQSINHLIEIATYYRQQGRSTEVQNLLVQYLNELSNDERLNDSGNDKDDILSVYNIDLATAQELFLLCNEFSSRLTVQGFFDQAQILIEQALLISKFMPVKLQSCLLSNISCYYERKNEMKSARLYYEHAIELWQQATQGSRDEKPDSAESSEAPKMHGASTQEEELSNAINQAINFNNLSVIELRQKNYAEAQRAAKNALNCLESKMMEQINNSTDVQLKTNVNFIENLLVLLVAYFNFGMCQLKTSMKSTDVAQTPFKASKALEDGLASFQHALKISNRFLGQHHYFSQKLLRKAQHCSQIIRQVQA